MRVIFCGTRDVPVELARKSILEALMEFGKTYKIKITEIVEGGSGSVDIEAGKIADEYGVTHTTFHANWTKQAKAAGPIRNQRMIDYVTLMNKDARGLIAIHDGISPGTADCIKAAKDAGITHTIIKLVTRDDTWSKK